MGVKERERESSQTLSLLSFSLSLVRGLQDGARVATEGSVRKMFHVSVARAPSERARAKQLAPGRSRKGRTLSFTGEKKSSLWHTHGCVDVEGVVRDREK